MEAKKSRNEKPTEKSNDEILNKFKMNGYLDYSLESVVITMKGGSEVRTFNLKYVKKMGAIKKAMLTDGMWMLVSNITKTTEPEEYRLGTEKFISIYRDKNRVEEGFKEVKAFLKFRPTFVYSNDHVRTHLRYVFWLICWM